MPLNFKTFDVAAFAKPDLPVEHFMVDPPWDIGGCGKRKARPMMARTVPYPTMPVVDIFALLDRHIFPLAAPDHNVFLWTVDKFLHRAENAMKERGYRTHARLIWDKVNGIPAAFTVRYSHEYCLWMYKGKLRPVAERMRGKYGTVLRENSRQHSRKPERMYAMLEHLYPRGSMMDVFARERRDGWYNYGNDIDRFK